MRPTQLLNPADRERIEQAVRQAEAGTSGEIVVAVVRSCDEYRVAGWRCGVLLAALVLLGLGLLRPDLDLWALALAQGAALTLGGALTQIDAIARIFVSEAQLEASARRRALAVFTERGLHGTVNQTGILILIALFEHRVVVWGDEAVNAALAPDESWEEVVELALSGIGRGAATEGIVAATARCGEILSHPLPARARNPDEIPHGLVLED